MLKASIILIFVCTLGIEIKKSTFLFKKNVRFLQRYIESQNEEARSTRTLPVSPKLESKRCWIFKKKTVIKFNAD